MKRGKSIHILNGLLVVLIIFNIYSFITGRLQGLNLAILGSVQILMIGIINSVHHMWITHIEDQDIVE
ncbi:hypothetical protein F7984_17340 [Pradoshia sp. D12]|uniref:hypothetical protein n=1 Tax=Bacillaceae TaxID=186817 RepID=UPI0011225EA5|nr:MULTISPECIES: hypothetical protein [Bacillaceae]QFK72861.1 hypothetical protein F7984_17340 [Pradoshia sp. D12]TPF71854.1 hypothetical protein FHY44_10035 [Bacillus sp. D12]